VFGLLGPAAVSGLLGLGAGVSACRRGPAREPSPEALRGAVMLYQRGELLEAAAVYEALGRDHPRSLEVQLGHAGTLLALKRYDEARAAYERAARDHPEDPGPPFGLGETLFAERRFDEAVAAYRKLAELRPKEAWVRGRIGAVLHEAGEHGQAVAAFDEAVALDARYFTCGCRPMQHGAYLDARRKAGLPEPPPRG
jgi:tetratricopeptide (TPR) repeat protein